MIPTENQEAEALARWLRGQGYRFTHIANESGLPPRVAMLASVRKKRMGTSPGFPDYCICLRRGSLLFVELKRQCTTLKNGKQGKSPSVVSEEQVAWIEALDKIDNVGAIICYGAQEAIETIQKLDDL